MHLSAGLRGKRQTRLALPYIFEPERTYKRNR